MNIYFDGIFTGIACIAAIICGNGMIKQLNSKDDSTTRPGKELIDSGLYWLVFSCVYKVIHREAIICFIGYICCFVGIYIYYHNPDKTRNKQIAALVFVLISWIIFLVSLLSQSLSY